MGRQEESAQPRAPHFTNSRSSLRCESTFGNAGVLSLSDSMQRPLFNPMHRGNSELITLLIWTAAANFRCTAILKHTMAGCYVDCHLQLCMGGHDTYRLPSWASNTSGWGIGPAIGCQLSGTAAVHCMKSQGDINVESQ